MDSSIGNRGADLRRCLCRDDCCVAPGRSDRSRVVLARRQGVAEAGILCVQRAGWCALAGQRTRALRRVDSVSEQAECASGRCVRAATGCGCGPCACCGVARAGV